MCYLFFNPFSQSAEYPRVYRKNEFCHTVLFNYTIGNLSGYPILEFVFETELRVARFFLDKFSAGVESDGFRANFTRERANFSFDPYEKWSVIGFFYT